MFDALQPAASDAIFGLNDQFLRDPNPDKINLTVGAYQDDQGRTPVLASVRAVERALLEQETTKNYLAMEGLSQFNHCVGQLVLGGEHPALACGAAVTLQTLGGTGALRLCGEVLARTAGCSEIWLSEPTWPNHLSIFRAAGLTIRRYRYFDLPRQRIDGEGMLADLDTAPAGAAVLLHVVCHNPSGADPAPAHWAELAELFRRRRLVPVFDFAYQGYGESPDADRAPLAFFADSPLPLFIAHSFSKNMGLYGERAGSCTLVAPDPPLAETLLSHLKFHARCMYSNAVRHTAYLVAGVLGDPARHAQWLDELQQMRERLAAMRRLLAEQLRHEVPDVDWSYLEQQRGMFSFVPLQPQQAQRLRDESSIYILDNGRINVAGVRPSNIQRLGESIARVWRTKSAANSAPASRAQV